MRGVDLEETVRPFDHRRKLEELPVPDMRSMPLCAPAGRRPLARASPPTLLLSQVARQGCFPWCPAKSITFGTPKVPSIVGLAPPGGRFVRVTERSDRDPGEGGDCPQVVPSLWITRRRLFNPCRLGTC